MPQARGVREGGTGRIHLRGVHSDSRRSSSEARRERSGITRPSAEALAERMRLRPMPEAARHSMSLYVDHTGEPLRAWNYVRVPWEVVCDTRLKPLDIRVYCMISGPTFQAATSKVGTRRIADCVHASRRLVIGSIRRLEDCGHIKRGKAIRGRREVYVVTSDVFCQKQRAGIEEVISSPSSTPRLASTRRI